MKHKFRLLEIVIVIILLLPVFPFSVIAETITGECGTSCYYEYNSETNTLRIYGSGRMKNYNNKTNNSDGSVSWVNPATHSLNRPWFDYRNKIECIVIEDGVTSIGNCSFAGFEKLYNISIADSVSAIGENSFYDCFSIESIILPEYIEYIGGGAFSLCSSLSSFTFPDTLNSVPESMFYGCKSLQHISIPNGVISIKPYAFFRSGIEAIDLPETLQIIFSCAFCECDKLTSITFPSSVSRIGSQYSDWMEIGDVFWGCSSLKEIYFTGDAPLIQDSSFNSVVATVYYPSNNDTYTYKVKRNYKGTLTWTPSCDHTQIIIVPAVEPTCEEKGVSEGGYCALCGKTIIKQQEIPAFGHEFGNLTYKYDKDINQVYSVRICSHDQSHIETKYLYTINLPTSLRIIQEEAFANLTCEAVIIPMNCSFVGEKAFIDCKELKYVRLPSNTTVASNAFDGCDDVFFDFVDD